jgi:hypothetical protein
MKIIRSLTLLCISLGASIIFLCSLSCQGKIEPTYKEKDIPSIVKKICKDEYGLDVTTQRTHNTLWIYAAVEKILHKDYGVKKDKIFDEELVDKLRNILNTVGRVLISSDNTPDFFALVASDVKIGLDYTIIGNVLDIKKSYAGFIPWTEANRRYVLKFQIAPSAIGDYEGWHLKAYDIKLPDFLAEQIAQRIGLSLQEENLKNYFQVEKSEGKFSDGIFTFEYAIKQIAQSEKEKEIDIEKTALNTIAYCLKTYEFKDFSGVTVKNLISGNTLELNQAAILTKPTD